MTQDDLKLVLDALKFCHGGEPCGTAEAIAVVEKALAQTQEPVADDFFKMIADRNPKPFPLPQRSESSGKPSAWVGLTDDEIAQAIESINMLHGDYATEIAYAIEAKLKEKNNG